MSTEQNPFPIPRAAFETFGLDIQVDKAMEECAELILALQKWRHDRCNNLEVISEIADVEVVLQSLRSVFTPNVIDHVKEYKLDRLKKRILRRNPNVRM